MKPGEHKVLGCGVYTEPYFEPDAGNLSELELSLEAVSPEGCRAYHQLNEYQNVLGEFNVLYAIREYARRLRTQEHCAALSPANIARDLTYLIRYGTVHPEGKEHYEAV